MLLRALLELSFTRFADGEDVANSTVVWPFNVFTFVHSWCVILLM